MYSHVVYDIVDGERVVVNRPDIVILEGLNVLQTGNDPTEFVSDYFDFSIYLDAEEDDIEQWYIERFLTLRESVFQDPEVVLPALRRSRRRRGGRHGPRDLARASTGSTCARTSPRPASGPR